MLYDLKVISYWVNEKSLVWAGEILILDVRVWVCYWDWEQQTDRSRGKERWRQRKGNRKQTDSEAGWQKQSESLKVSVSASCTTMEDTQHDTLPSFPLKTHLLLTDEKHNASVTWTLICSSYLSNSPAFPQLIKTDNQIETEGWRQAEEFPRIWALQSFPSQGPKIDKFSFSTQWEANLSAVLSQCHSGACWCWPRVYWLQ